MAKELNRSRFYMWRAVVAMVHADGVVTPHELSFVNDYVKDLSLSQEQLDIVGMDLHKPQSAYNMFSEIVYAQDKKDFFVLARALSWCDGDYDAQEKLIIEHLEKGSFISEDADLLRESRNSLNEVELCRNQWEFKTDKSRNLFSFLKGMKGQAA